MNKVIFHIIKNKEIIQFVRITLLIVLILLIIFKIIDNTNFFEEEIICGAEKTIIKDGKEYFEANGYVFNDANNRSTEKVFSGTYSLKLTPEIPYGMQISLDIPKPNEVYEVSVWSYFQNPIDSNCSGYIVASSGNKFWKCTSECIEKRNGWKKMYIKFIIPNEKFTEPLSFYCWNNSKNIIYFAGRQNNCTAPYKNPAIKKKISFLRILATQKRLKHSL